MSKPIIPPPTIKETAPYTRMSGEARRQQLLEVAICLFSQKGFSGTRTKEIAAAAQVNEAILFRHFASKEELYAAMLDCKAGASQMEQLLGELSEHAERRDDEGVFCRFATHILAHHRQDHDFLRLMLYAALEAHDLLSLFIEKHVLPLHIFLRDYIITRQGEGAFIDIDPDAAVRAFAGMPNHHALVTSLLALPIPNIPDELAIKTFTDIFLRGMRREASRE